MVQEEFYAQGDKERGNMMKISALCDRNVSASNYPSSQIGFISFVVKPVFTLMSEVCFSVSTEEKPWLLNLNFNLAYWEDLKIKGEKGETA